MAAKTVEIQVQNDHLARLAQVRKPIDPFALNAGGSVKLGMDDRHEYSLGGGARAHF